MLVDDYLARSATRLANKVALVCGGRRLSYGQVAEAADRVAGGFRELGVSPGQRVVIHLENGVDAVLAIWGALRAGGVIVVVHPGTKPDKLRYIARDCGAAVLVSGAGSGAASLVPDGVPAVVQPGADAASPQYAACTFEALLASPPLGGDSRDPRIDLDLAAIVYTSGSTGTPKGVMLSHANMVAALTSITSYLGLAEDDVILSVMPLSFDYGLYQLLMTVALGATLVLERSFSYPVQLLEVLARERATGLPIVPTIAALLLRQDFSPYDLSALRFVTSTGAAFPPAHIVALRGKLPNVKLYSMYGLTEAKRVSFLAPEELPERPASVGKPMPNVEVFVADAEGRLHERGTGELVVRGSNVMQGYWGRPEETDRVLRPGALPGERVLYTGDIFRIDEDGYLYFISRKDDIIKSRGEKVSPKEIETVICELAGVVEAAVIGVPDPVLGAAVKACVTVQPGAEMTEREIACYCARRLEPHLVPRTVEILAQMPRTATGKIDRAELRRLAS